MKMVLGKVVFIIDWPETHWYTFSMRNFTSVNSVNFPEHKTNYTASLAARNYLLT